MKGRCSSAAVLVVMLLAAACTGSGGNDEPVAESPVEDPNAGYPPLDPPEARVSRLEETALLAGFEIEPYEPGQCRFDYRSQVARISAQGETKWVIDVPWIAGSGPLVVGDTLVGRFAGGRQGLFALDVVSGSPRWQRFFDDGRIQDIGSDGVASLSVRTRSSDASQTIEVLDARSGRTVSRTEVGLGWTIELLDGVAVIDTEDGLAALRDGVVAWEVMIDTSETMLHRYGDLVLADHYPAVLTAHRPSDGTEVWRWESGDPDTAAFVRAIVDDMVVLDLAFAYEQGGEPPADGSDRGVVVLDANTGEEMWSRRAVDAELVGEMLLLRGTGVSARELVRLRDGSSLGEPPRSVWAQKGAGELISVTREETEEGRGVLRSALIRATDGSTIWEPAEAVGVGTLAKFDDVVLAGTWTSSDSSVVTADPGGTLFALDSQTGEQLWSVQLRDPLGFQPTRTIDGDFIVTASDPVIGCH